MSVNCSHRYYNVINLNTSITWAVPGQSANEPESANKEHGRLRKEDMLGLYLYLTSGYFKRKSGNHGWALDIKDLKDHFKMDLHLRT